MFQYFTQRSRAAWAVIAVVLALIVASGSTISVAHANGHTTMPSTSPTPGGKATGPKPNFIVPGGGETGQTSDGGTSNAFCNGHLYTGWAGTDGHINVAWDFNGSGFNGKVAYADTAFENRNNTPTIYTRPALACWQRPGDIMRLWIFFTGTNDKLYLGYYEPGDENQEFETIHTHYGNGDHIQVPNQSSQRSPALAPYGGTLRIGWVGVNNGYLNFESTTDGANFGSPNTWKAEVSDGGFGMTVWCVSNKCKIWFAWTGTDNPHHINVGYFDLSSAIWEPTAAPTADFTCELCDLTLVLQSGTLRIPYAGSGLYDNLNIDNSTDGVNWNNDQSQAGSLWGAGAAIDSQNHFWVTFPEWNSLSTNALQIVIFQYN